MSRFVVLACLVLLVWPHVATAGLIVSSGDIGAPSKTVDFSQFKDDYTLTTGPEQIGGLVGENITWSSTFAHSVIGSVSYLLGDNGDWDTSRAFTGSNDDSAVMTYQFFDGPVSAVGGFLNYGVELGVFVEPVLIQALDINGNVLESYDLLTLAPISTPGELNAGAFRGIVRATNDIYAFAISGRAIALDDLTFSRAPVATTAPEPATVWLMAIGAVTSFCALRSSRRRPAG